MNPLSTKIFNATSNNQNTNRVTMEDGKLSSEIHFGKFSLLDQQYKDLYEEMVLNAETNKEIEKCDLQDMLLKNLVSQGEVTLFYEIKYRLTDGEDPMSVLLEVLQRREDLRSFLWDIEARIEDHMFDEY